MTLIVTLTLNPAIDLSYEVDAIVPTQKLRTWQEQTFPGGGGINVARVLARLGKPSTCVYLAGGATGPSFEALLAEQGLPRARIEDAHSQAAHVRYEANTQRAIAAGVFGAPTYIIDGEMFWGQDRLDFVQRRLAR